MKIKIEAKNGLVFKLVYGEENPPAQCRITGFLLSGQKA